MIVFFFVYAVLILWGIKFVRNDNDVLSFSQTNALKGIGIMTVFFNHIYNDYLTPHNVGYRPIFDTPFVYFETHLTAMFVGMFLFFSGYGVYESYKKKGKSYIDQMPIKRIGTTLFNFDIAVVVFLIADLLLQVSLKSQDVALAFVGWESIGNSNWYIFAILCCYLASYLSFKISRNSRQYIVILSLLICLYTLMVYLYRFPWWYNTILCYPAGVLYSSHKEKLNSVFAKKYCLFAITFFVIYITSYLLSARALFILHNISAIAFCFLCVLVSFKVRLQSKPLIWLGSHLFPIYIYQRLPMLVIDNIYPELIENTPPRCSLSYVC